MKRPALAIALFLVIVIAVRLSLIGWIYNWSDFSGLFAVIAAISLAVLTGRSERFMGLSWCSP